MQSASRRCRGEYRLLILSTLWLISGLGVYFVAGHPNVVGALPPGWQMRLASLAVQQGLASFPIFAYTISLSLWSVWALRCSTRDGVLIVCGGWLLVEAASEFGGRSDVASWVIPRMPQFFYHVWPLNRLETVLGNAAFNSNHLAAALLGALIAYMVAINSMDMRRVS